MSIFLCAKCDKYRDCDEDECYEAPSSVSPEYYGLVCGDCYNEIMEEEDDS